MSFQAATAKLQKAFGKGVGGLNPPLSDALRIPSGILPFDLMTGGGIPTGRVIEFFGPEGSNKSNTALKILGNAQRMFPNKKCAVIDIENCYDPPWWNRMGVDTDSLFTFKPKFAEEAIDIIDELMKSPECCLILLDSLAAMSTQAEVDKPAEGFDPGGGGRISKRLFGKILTRQREAEQFNMANGLTDMDPDRQLPTFLYINQIRHKIGVMFGSPETTPGGFTPRFACSMRVRFYGKDEQDQKISKTHAAVKKVNNVVVKHKVPIVSRESEWKMAMIPGNGMMPGEVDDWKTFWYYLQKHDLAGEHIEGKKKTWFLQEELFTTLTALQEKLDADPALADSLKAQIIKTEAMLAYNQPHNEKGAPGTDGEGDE